VYSATALSFFGFIIPFFTSIMGWFWLGEEVNIWFFISLIIVSFGLYLFYQEELKQGITVKHSGNK
jgi:drug/metabolite transporter (DMT)-like permease